MLDEDGSPLPFEARPLVIALQQRQPAHRAFLAHLRDGRRLRLESTAFPLQGQGGRSLGVLAILWETPAR
jgi:hypothetical protein